MFSLKCQCKLASPIASLAFGRLFRLNMLWIVKFEVRREKKELREWERMEEEIVFVSNL